MCQSRRIKSSNLCVPKSGCEACDQWCKWLCVYFAQWEFILPLLKMMKLDTEKPDCPSALSWKIFCTSLKPLMSSWDWTALHGSVGPQSANSQTCQWNLSAFLEWKWKELFGIRIGKKMQRARGERLSSLYFAFIGFCTMRFLGVNFWTF